MTGLLATKNKTHAPTTNYSSLLLLMILFEVITNSPCLTPIAVIISREQYIETWLGYMWDKNMW